MSTELTNSTTPKPKGYKGNLEDGREIYIPNWSATTQWENLTQACKILGQTNVMTISTLNIPAAMLAVMGSDDSKSSTELLLHFIQQARMENEKITPASIEDLGMATIIELFAHVMYAQYNSFFASGLAKAASLTK